MRVAVRPSERTARADRWIQVEWPSMRDRLARPTGVLAGIVLVSTIARLLAARALPTPWITPDETIYGLLGRGLFDQGRLRILDAPTGFYSLVSPAVIGLPLQLGDMALGYSVAKLLQALVMSLTAVPVFLWARTLMRPGFALAASALTVAVPGLAYSGTLMSEVAFYPAVTLAAWATARALDRPTLGRHAVLGAAVLLAVGTRLQAVVLLPAALTAVLLKALLERDPRRIRAHWPLAAAAALGALVLLIAGSASLGGYSVVAERGYRAGDAAAYVLYHAADLLLLCGVAPACAVALLAIEALRGRELGPSARSYLAVALSYSAWLVLEVAIFASRYAERIVERNLLCLAPLLFVGLALWLDRGAPRGYIAAAVVAFAAAALLVAVPYSRFVTVGGVQDSMTFAAVLDLLAAHPRLDPLLVLGVPAVALAAVTALLPRRATLLLVPLLVACFAAASVAASRRIEAQSQITQGLLVGPERRWIDRVADGPVAYVFAGGVYFNAVWVNAFWNRRMRHVYDLGGAVVRGPMPQQRLRLGGDGVLRAGGRPIPDRYAVLPSSLIPAGTKVASAQLTNADVATHDLWRLDGTPRILETRAGFNANGDVPVRASVREYDCARGGTFLVTLLGKITPQTVTLLVDGQAVRTVPLEEGLARTETVRVAAGRPGVCTLSLKPSAIVGTTVITFGRG